MSLERTLDENDQDLADVLATLSESQLRYVQARVTLPTDADAARAIGLTPGTVYNWPNKDIVNHAVELAQLDGVRIAQERLKRLLQDAVDAIADEVRGARRGAKRLDAAREVLDRVMGRPTQKVDQHTEHSGEVTVRQLDVDKLSDETLAELLALATQQEQARE